MRWKAEGSRIVGDVRIADEVSIWYNAVVRADHEPIIIDSQSNVQDGVIIHNDPGYPVRIGKNVSIGHGAIIHGACIGDNTVVGMGAIVMNGAKVGSNCLIAAGALVGENKIIPDGSLVMGLPARIIRPLSDEEIADNLKNAQNYILEAKSALRNNGF